MSSETERECGLCVHVFVFVFKFKVDTHLQHYEASYLKVPAWCNNSLGDKAFRISLTVHIQTHTRTFPPYTSFYQWVLNLRKNYMNCSVAFTFVKVNYVGTRVCQNKCRPQMETPKLHPRTAQCRCHRHTVIRSVF